MRIGIDWGGTKLEILALGPDGREKLRRRIPTPQHDYEACLSAVHRLIREAETELGETGSVGIGIPGAISPATGFVKNANSTWINGRALYRDLAARLGRPVRIDNDANCFALSEAIDGAGRGARVVFGVILGTGVGAGLVVDGRLLVGPQRIAGEWGHNPLPWPKDDERPGAPCFCGRSGCIERFCSGPGFAEDFAKASGRKLTPEAILAAAQAGDAQAEAAYRRYIDRLARALAHVINILDPDAIVLGGGMGKAARLYEDLPKALPAYVFTDAFTTPILPPVHGDSSGVRGAAWLWEG